MRKFLVLGSAVLVLAFGAASCGGEGSELSSSDKASFCQPIRDLEDWRADNSDAFSSAGAFSGDNVQRTGVLSEGATFYESALAQSIDFAPTDEMRDEMESLRQRAGDAADDWAELSLEYTQSDTVVRITEDAINPPADPTFEDFVQEACGFSLSFYDPYESGDF